MFNFRFKKEDPFKFRQKENSVECDVLPNFKPVPLEAVEDSLRALKESKSLSSIEEEQIRNTFFADKQEGLKGIVDLIDNSKLSFFRKYDLKSSIAKEAGFKVSMPPPKNISDTLLPGLNFGVVQRFYRELFVRIIGTTITLSLIPNIPPVLRSFTQLITGWASYLLPQQFRGDLVTSQQQPEEGLQLDDPISENGDAEKEVTILTYVDRSFEQDLTFIDGLVKTRSRSFLSDPSQLEFEKVLSKYMIILWSLEAYPDLITGIKPEDRSQIQEFVEKKLLDFAKGEDSHFSPNIFMKALRKTSEAGMSELDFAQRDHIIEPFKVKVVKDQEVISRRKRIINGLISEITLQIPTKL
jgi:hypothetical protein